MALYRVIENNHLRYARFLHRRGIACVGADTSINPRAEFMNAGRVTIGAECSVSHADFITHSGGDWAVYRRTGVRVDTTSRITVGDRTMIASGVRIIGPVRIGSDCVLCAGAVVTRDVPDGSVVAGVPARVIASTADFDKRQIARHERQRQSEGSPS